MIGGESAASAGPICGFRNKRTSGWEDVEY